MVEEPAEEAVAEAVVEVVAEATVEAVVEVVVQPRRNVETVRVQTTSFVTAHNGFAKLAVSAATTSIVRIALIGKPDYMVLNLRKLIILPSPTLLAQRPLKWSKLVRVSLFVLRWRRKMLMLLWTPEPAVL